MSARGYTKAFLAVIGILFCVNGADAKEVYRLDGYLSDEGGVNIGVPPLNLPFARTSYIAYDLTTVAPIISFDGPAVRANVLEYDKVLNITYPNLPIFGDFSDNVTDHHAFGIVYPQSLTFSLEPETAEYYDYIDSFDVLSFRVFAYDFNDPNNFQWPFTLRIFASVPEPSTWLLQVIGFALLGAVLRSRSTPRRFTLFARSRRS